MVSISRMAAGGKENTKPPKGFCEARTYMGCPDVGVATEQTLQSFLWVAAIAMAERPTRI